jgi:hypothetical protein
LPVAKEKEKGFYNTEEGSREYREEQAQGRSFAFALLSSAQLRVTTRCMAEAGVDSCTTHAKHTSKLEGLGPIAQTNCSIARPDGMNAEQRPNSYLPPQAILYHNLAFFQTSFLPSFLVQPISSSRPGCYGKLCFTEAKG